MRSQSSNRLRAAYRTPCAAAMSLRKFGAASARAVAGGYTTSSRQAKIGLAALGARSRSFSAQTTRRVSIGTPSTPLPQRWKLLPKTATICLHCYIGSTVLHPAPHSPTTCSSILPRLCLRLSSRRWAAYWMVWERDTTNISRSPGMAPSPTVGRKASPQRHLTYRRQPGLLQKQSGP